ncbi:MAG TPA: protease modulator HflC [Alphaproteobacteria bacterium]|nr:protease modulator HflC [Alphaproteobacteria bacterium]
MSQNKLNIFAVILLVAAVAASQSVFTVDQREQALVLQLGNPVGEPRSPGIHFKIPLIQEVKRFDGRVLSVDPAPEQVVIASSAISREKTREEVQREAEEKAKAEAQQDTAIAQEETEVDQVIAERPKIENVSGEPIIVDSFARYKIIDPLQFLKTLGTINIANSRLENILNDATRAVLGKTSLRELLSEERTYVMNDIRRRVNRKIQQDELGIEIIDVRIVRADLTKELRTSTVRRMISELQERATETRAKGEERAKEIKATAEKERTVILANAGRDAQILRGEGDKEAIKIYADAFNKDKEFYGFIRSMEAYKNTMANSETRLILSPDSDFFQYFDKQR